MVRIRGNLESQLFLSVDFKEFGKFTMEALRNLRQKLLCFLYFILQDADLEVHHRQKQAVGVDIKVLVYKVQSVLLSIVAENVLFFVSISKLHNFATNEIADAAANINEGKAV